MTNYERQGTAPIEDGDALDAAEIENEFVAIRAVINGGLDKDNLTSSAGILGTQLASNTIAENRITASTITTASLATSATIKAYVFSQDGGGTSMGTNTSWGDFPTITGTTLTPGAAGDMIVLDCTAHVNVSVGDVDYALGFSVGGTDTNELALVSAQSGETWHTVSWSWMVAAASTAPVALIPRIKVLDAGSAALGSYNGTAGILISGYYSVFRAKILPIK